MNDLTMRGQWYWWIGRTTEPLKRHWGPVYSNGVLCGLYGHKLVQAMPQDEGELCKSCLAVARARFGVQQSCFVGSPEPRTQSVTRALSGLSRS